MKKVLTPKRAWGTIAKTLLQTAFFLLLSSSLFAQQTVQGRISDDKGTPLSGATVQVKGTATSARTNEQGTFSLSVPSASSVLVISFVGHEPKEIAIKNQSTVNVSLVPANATMGEVVVIGYGTQRKSDLTGAISSVSAKDLSKATPINATEALQGRAAGVMVTQNTSSPGSEGTIRIRGIGTVNNNDPLYVVDGMFVSSIGFLNPSDIARIEVLKDASATAIYGSRGANGVILITTQRGTSGKPTIVFNGNTSVGKVSNVTKGVNATQYLDYIKTAYLNGYLRSVANPNPNIDPFTTTDPFFATVKLVKAEYDKGNNTDWAKELFKTAVVQSYDLGIRGGANNVRYAASAGYFDQKGILENSSFKRYTFRLNTDYTLGKRLVVGENLNITHSSVLGGTGFGEGRSNSIVAMIIGADPIMPVLNPAANPNDPDYLYNKYGPSVTGGTNPAAAIARINDRNNVVKLLGNVYGELDIVRGLKLRTSLGYDYENVDFSSFSPRFFITSTDQNPTSQVNQNTSSFIGQVWENTLNYNTKTGNHAITGLLGYTEELYKGKFTNASRQGTANNDPGLQVLNSATGTISLAGNKTNYALRSYFARANYSYADRYLLTATVRRDGSSKFASDRRWGTFPSVSTGWRISNEKFFKNGKALSFISSLKLRAGWGQIGNQSMPGGTNNPYLSLVEGINNYRYIIGDALANGNYLTSLGTPSVTWETAEQTNVGLDLGLIKNKLTFTADYFVRNTKNMLLQVQLPSNAGFPSIPYTNAGEIQNKGYEIALTYQGTAGRLNYSLSANASHFDNKVVNLGAGNKPVVYSDVQTQLSINRTEVGRSIGEFYGWVTDGIFQNTAEVNAYNKNGQKIQPNALPGDFRFKDINGDGTIDANDRTWIGNPNPKLLYGFNLNLEYKGFDLTALFQGSYGNKLFNVNKKYFYRLNAGTPAALAPYEAAWRGEGTSTTQPIISSVDRNDNFRVSDWYVQDGSYMRLKNLQIGYRLPEAFLRRAGISGSRIWVGGTDLFTITNYKGNDPEAGLSANPLATGWEFSPYPKMKRFSIGLNVTL